MPKLKTRKSVAKRFRVTKNGKVVRRSAKTRHLATAKTRKKKRMLRGATKTDPVNARVVKPMMPYG
jgi:large subunit ribosomal protein L35